MGQVIYPNRKRCATKPTMPDSENLPSRAGTGPGQEASRLLGVLEQLFGGRREQLLHDVWTLRSVFSSPQGPWRRAGFASRVLVRAATAEMKRFGALCSDPLEAAFWILTEQRLLLNHDVVDERMTRALFACSEQLRPSQHRAARRILRSRSENLQHDDGGPGSNLLLLACTAGGLSWIQDLDSYCAAIDVHFHGDPPLRTSGLAGALLLEAEDRTRLDERALAIDLAHRIRGRGA